MRFDLADCHERAVLDCDRGCTRFLLLAQNQGGILGYRVTCNCGRVALDFWGGLESYSARSGQPGGSSPAKKFSPSKIVAGEHIPPAAVPLNESAGYRYSQSCRSGQPGRTPPAEPPGRPPAAGGPQRAEDGLAQEKAPVKMK